MNQWMRGGVAAAVLATAVAAGSLISTDDAQAQVPVIAGKGKLEQIVRFSGVLSGGKKEILTVPDGERFVVTDIVASDYSSGNEVQSLHLFGTAPDSNFLVNIRQGRNFSHSFGTGIVFGEGETVSINALPSENTWAIVTGYTIRLRPKMPSTFETASDSSDTDAFLADLGIGTSSR